ncbi:TonB-dependent receptor [Flavobacterium lacustre]|uniref:TonB-dependent receptor n=1 Tax=Flavobacterium lacustre TaxID=3016339 RepID=UPI0022B68406|nr:carboxypeptidase-like regulatory domain-containing protein [Flavobacterium lacustre]
MKTMKNWLLTGLMLLVVSTVFSQGKVTGTITDGQGALPGANVAIKGTTAGSSSDIDGKFSVDATANSGELVITYLGFETKTVKFSVSNGGTTNLGTIILTSDSNQLEEIVVVGRGLIDLAKERKTPIAVSTIKAAEIQTKVGAADVTQAFVNTPSVYVAGQAGGFGDSRISVRGFQQDNTAFLLNGQPINGMEDGKMYWSNWSGMSDIANFIQVQRGLGSSKLAISSVGGTVNFVTKATDKKEGGFISTSTANNDYLKTTAAYNSGIMKNGFGVSVLLSHWQGDGYNKGTFGQGQSYFISFGYKANDKHSFNFLLTGAPQWHDQNFTKKISDYLGFGRNYNNNYGYLNGQYISERTNFYHKPVANFNWDYKISDKTDLSTVVYASWGRGGGTGNYGSGKKSISEVNPYTGLSQSTYIDFDQIYSNNSALADADQTFAKSYLIRSSMNNHAWYGVVSNLKTKLNENISFNAGIDLRTYKGTHYRQVNNFLGLTSFTDVRKLRGANHLTQGSNVSQIVNKSMSTDPWGAFFNKIDNNQKIDYDYSEKISYGGLFGQLEYSKDNLSAFLQASVSNQSHQRFDVYDYLPEFKDSEKVNNLGFNVKTGGSFKINESNSLYVNAGYYSRQPYHDNIYLNFTNEVNPLTSNEKILGLEAGYNFKINNFSASLNAYRTSWEDRVVSSSRVVTALTETVGTTVLAQGDLVYKSNLGVQQLHTGLELDFVYKPFKELNFKGFASIGDWKYKGNSTTRETDENQNLLKESLVDVDGGRVGDAAQTTWGLGADYFLSKNVSFDLDWRTYDKLYANSGAIKENLMLPTYDLVDAGATYKMFVGKNKQNTVSFRLTMNNIFDEVYLSELSGTPIKASATLGSGTYESAGRTYKGIADANQGYFGFGRTWNFTLRYNF